MVDKPRISDGSIPTMSFILSLRASMVVLEASHSTPVQLQTALEVVQLESFIQFAPSVAK
jgi:hypothetical protein